MTAFSVKGPFSPYFLGLENLVDVETPMIVTITTSERKLEVIQIALG